MHSVCDANGRSKKYVMRPVGCVMIISQGHLSSSVLTPGSVHSQDGGLAEVISHCVSGVGLQLPLSLLILTQQDAYSVAMAIFCTALLLARPGTPRPQNIHHADCAGEPRHPTSTGKGLAVGSRPSRCHTLIFPSRGLPHSSLPMAR